MGRKLSVAIAGLGSRGRMAYARATEQFQEEMEIVAIADIVPEKVEAVAREYDISPEMCFLSAEDLLKQDQLADILFICTMDRQHYGHAVPALEKGYHLLLEKPISPELSECREIAEAAKKYDRQVIVCHVLRYTPFFRKLKALLQGRVIGDLIHIQASENVGYWHQAHSFVRGNWRSSAETSPMILQKCCHDMDILLWLAGKSCKSVSSFGSLRHFRPESAPAGAGKRCLDGCTIQKDCPFDAERLYLTEGVCKGNTDWPVDVLTVDVTEENVREALKMGPYGRCVYHCDNDVVDHQAVNLWLEDDVVVSFTMCAFTEKISRRLHLMGTRGEIFAYMENSEIVIQPFGGDKQVYRVGELEKDIQGHGGGDVGIIQEVIRVLNSSGENEASLTAIEKSVESHYVALAAEHSRIHGGILVEIEPFAESLV